MPELVSKCSVCLAFVDDEDLFCANCGTEAPQQQDDEDGERGPALGSRLFTHNFDCRGCGASMSYDASVRALRCPFCGSEKLEEQPDQKALSPKFVVPFKVSQDQANRVLKKMLGTGFWRPGDLAATAKVTQMTAAYVPYWIFRAKTFTYWNADSSVTPLGARADWCPMHGSNRSTYYSVLIGASSTLSPAETDAIGPFNLDEQTSPDQVDLDNVTVEQFRVQRKYARPLARSSFQSLERDACSEHVPGRHRNLKVNVMLQGMWGEPALLPVWVMAYQYKDQMFRCLVNGQTGRTTGTAPFSWRKLAVVVGVGLGILAVLALILAIVNR